MSKTRAYGALLKPRGSQPVDMAQLEGVLVRFSQLVVQQPCIREIEINPLLATARGLMALDARIVIAPAGECGAPTFRPAIRPYPHQYTWHSQTTGGQPLVIRPLRPEDEPHLVAFHERLSDETVYLRYFNQQKLSRRTAHARLIRSCFLDYDRQVALAAMVTAEKPVLAGVARLIRKHNAAEADFSIVVSDDFHHQGIGTGLMTRLLEVARAEKITRITGIILNENHPMQTLARKVGFRLEPQARDCFSATLDLKEVD